MPETTIDDTQGQTHWVKPALPTILNDREWLPLPPTDLILESMNVAWVLPGPLDLQKFKHALALALRDYPHHAGRLSFDAKTQQWRILLNNEGVPITLGSTQHPGIFSDSFKHERDPEFYDSLNISDFVPVDVVKSPLMKFKLTTWEKTGETSIMITKSHTTGDIFTFVNMMQAFSNYYQNLPVSTMPTFDKYLRPDPIINPDDIHHAIPYLSFLTVDYDLHEYSRKFAAMLARITRVDLKFSAEQITTLFVLASQGTDAKISPMDAVAAYVISVIQRVSDVPIERLQRIFGTRGIKQAPGSTYVPPSNTTAGNPFMIVDCKERLGNSETSISKIASVLRDQMNELRDPVTFQRVYSLYSYIYDRSAKIERLPWEWPTENAVQVNVVTRVPFGSVHFGYPGKSRMYSWDVWQNFFEICAANPVKLSNGEYKSYEGGVDVWFGLKHSLKPKFLRVFDDDMRAMGFGEAIGRDKSRL